MYLISLYFDEGTNKKIQLYMEQIAQRTGNMAMIDGKVPPHITLSAFDMAEEEKAIAGFMAMEQEFEKGQIFWCSVGMFLPHTIYLSPVLNAYLQKEEQERRSYQKTASPFFFFILFSILKPLSAHCAFPQKTYHFPGRQYPKCAGLPPVPRKLRFYCITPFASNV